jgi:hypothetical protein
VIARLVELELGARACGTLGVEVQQLGGGIPRLLGGFALRFVPLVGAEPVQRRFFGGCAAVARHEVQAQHRHVELVAAGVFEQQELRGHAFDVERGKPAVAPDTVVFVHDGCPDLQVRELADDRLGVARPALALALLPRPLHSEVGGRDQAQPVGWEAEAVVDLADRDAERRVAHEEALPVGVDVRLVAAVAQELEQHLAVTRRGRGQQRSLPLLGAEPPVDPVVGCGDAGRERMRHTRVVVLGRGVRRKRQDEALVDAGAQLVGADERFVGPQDRPLDVAAQLLIALFDQLP